jgi:hypothetical protein
MQGYLQLGKDCEVLQCRISDYCNLISENRSIKKKKKDRNCVLFLLSSYLIFIYAYCVDSIKYEKQDCYKWYAFIMHLHLPSAVKLLAPAPLFPNIVQLPLTLLSSLTTIGAWYNSYNICRSFVSKLERICCNSLTADRVNHIRKHCDLHEVLLSIHHLSEHNKN